MLHCLVCIIWSLFPRIGFPDDYLKSWVELGGHFLAYVTEECGDDKLRGAFPVVWNKFLREKQLEDTFEWN